MLVLSRRCGEKIMIGEDIVVTILSVHGPRIKVGLDAPRGVSIRREELLPTVEDRAANRDVTECSSMLPESEVPMS